MRTTLILSPAYGRDYKTAKAAKADLWAGKDFIIENFQDPYCGKPINLEQIEAGTRVHLRFSRLTKTAVVTAPEKIVYDVPGSNRVPIVKHQVKGQPVLAPPTEEDKARVRSFLDNHYGDRPVPKGDK